MEKYQYSRINKLRWSDKEIARRKAWHCDEHGHSGITHPNCYNAAHDIVERKGGLDIEAGALNADFDIMLSWAIKPIYGGATLYDNVTHKDIVTGAYDSRICATLVQTIWEFDRVITHYGNNARFDMPFIRSRYMWLDARKMYDGPEFPGFGMLWQTDTFTMAKQKTKISSRRQDNIASCILNKDVKTKIDKNHWMAVKYGSTKERTVALNYIVEHNLADVEQLVDNYLTLLPFCREARTSI
jgi:hypothetical protein